MLALNSLSAVFVLSANYNSPLSTSRLSSGIKTGLASKMRVKVQSTGLQRCALVSVVCVVLSLTRAFPFFQGLAMLQNPSSTSRGHLAPLLTSPLQPDYCGRRDSRRSVCSCKHKALTTCLHDSQSPHHAKADAFFQSLLKTTALRRPSISRSDCQV